jgi:RNA polymerase sigma-70 factor (ECF subfamily)
MSRCLPSISPLGAAFHDVYREHAPMVRRALRRLGVDVACLEDATQDVFVVLHRRASQFERGRKLESWLWGIARGVASTYRRSARRRQRLSGALPREQSTSCLDRDLARGEAAQILDRFLHDLDDDKCAVFVLADLEGRTGPEISERLHVNLNTVYARLRAARHSFQRAVAAHRVDDAPPLFAAWWPALLSMRWGAMATMIVAAIALPQTATDDRATTAIASAVIIEPIDPPPRARAYRSSLVAARPEPTHAAIEDDDVQIEIEIIEPHPRPRRSQRPRRDATWIPTRIVSPIDDQPPELQAPPHRPWSETIVARTPPRTGSLIEIRADFVGTLLDASDGL